MAKLDQCEWIWHEGEWVKWEDAKIHVLSHGLHYGTSFFEGIRAYETTHKGTCVFRLNEHNERFKNSAKIYGLDLPESVETINEICREVLRRNNLKSAYLRPIAWVGYENGLKVGPDSSVLNMSIAAFPWGAYLGEGGLENGVDVCISTWNRVAPNTIPAAAKAGGNYLSGFLISQEARKRGCAEGIALGTDGRISEAGGANVFIIKGDTIDTPPIAASILGGITRDTVITLAGRLGYKVREEQLTREFLYLADEVFFTGTAAEVTPIRSVDGIKVGIGKRGPITEKIQSAFFGLFDGSTEDVDGWLDPIGEHTGAKVATA